MFLGNITIVCLFCDMREIQVMIEVLEFGSLVRPDLFFSHGANCKCLLKKGLVQNQYATCFPTLAKYLGCFICFGHKTCTVFQVSSLVCSENAINNVLTKFFVTEEDTD